MSFVSKEKVKRASKNPKLSEETKAVMSRNKSLFVLDARYNWETKPKKITLTRSKVIKIDVQDIKLQSKQEKAISIKLPDNKAEEESKDFVLMINKTKINNVSKKEIKELLLNVNETRSTVRIKDKRTDNIFTKEEFLNGKTKRMCLDHIKEETVLMNKDKASSFGDNNNKTESVVSQEPSHKKVKQRFENVLRSYDSSSDKGLKTNSISIEERSLDISEETDKQVLLEELDNSPAFESSLNDQEFKFKYGVIDAELFMMEMRKEMSLLKKNLTNNNETFRYQAIDFTMDVDEVVQTNQIDNLNIIDKVIVKTVEADNRNTKYQIKEIKRSGKGQFKNVLNKDQIKLLKQRKNKYNINIMESEGSIMNKLSVTTASLTQPTTPNSNTTKKLLNKNRLRAKGRQFRPKIDSIEETEMINLEIKRNWQREMLFNEEMSQKKGRQSIGFTSVLF